VQARLHNKIVCFDNCFQWFVANEPVAKLSKSVWNEWVSYDLWYTPALSTRSQIRPVLPVSHQVYGIYFTQNAAIGEGRFAMIAVMTVTPNREEMDRGLDLFNRAHFFDAHEVLEDVWRSIPRDRPRDEPHDRPSAGHLRLHVQGMVQLAVAFHHQSKGNHVGARSVLERALRNLNGADSSFPELDLDRLRAELALWQRFLADAGVARAKGAGTKTKKDKKKFDGRVVAEGSRRSTTPALPRIMWRR
jgi:predicted metal-dependent hydrolase